MGHCRQIECGGGNSFTVPFDDQRGRPERFAFGQIGLRAGKVAEPFGVVANAAMSAYRTEIHIIRWSRRCPKRHRVETPGGRVLKDRYVVHGFLRGLLDRAQRGHVEVCDGKVALGVLVQIDRLEHKPRLRVPFGRAVPECDRAQAARAHLAQLVSILAFEFDRAFQRDQEIG